MSKALEKLLKINPEDAIEKAVGVLIRHRPFISKIFLKFNRISDPTCPTIGVGFNKDKINLVYNPNLIRLSAYCGDEVLAKLLMHEVLHVVLNHLDMCDEINFEANLLMDIAVNSLVHLRKPSPTKMYTRSNMIIRCPMCIIRPSSSVLNTLDDYKNGYADDIVTILELNKQSKESYCCYCKDTRLHEFTFEKILEIILKYRQHSYDRVELAREFYSLFNKRSAVSSLSSMLKDCVNILKMLEVSKQLFVPSLDSMRELYEKEDAEFLYSTLYPEDKCDSSGRSVRNSSDEELVRIKSSIESELIKIRGTTEGADFIEIIDNIKKGKSLPWQRYLRNRICTSANSYKIETRLKPHRRFGFEYPGDIKVPKMNVVIGIDTSGSMSDASLEEIKKCIYGLKGSINIDCTVVEFDCVIHRSYDVSKMDKAVSGRGGTSFTPLIEWLEEEKIPPSIVFVFTDGYGDLEVINPSAANRHSYHWMIISPNIEHFRSLLTDNLKKSFLHETKFERK